MRLAVAIVFLDPPVVVAVEETCLASAEEAEAGASADHRKVLRFVVEHRHGCCKWKKFNV